MAHTYAPIPNVIVIGITGRARHGKDTLAIELLKDFSGAERFAFSDGLSAYCRATGKMTERDPRVLQEEGTRLRMERENVWLDVLYGAIQDRAPRIAIITGVRFPNEAQMIRDMGGVIVRVTRYDADGRLYCADDRDPNHASEAALDSIIADVEFSGCLEDRCRRASEWVKWYVRSVRMKRHNHGA